MTNKTIHVDTAISTEWQELMDIQSAIFCNELKALLRRHNPLYKVPVGSVVYGRVVELARKPSIKYPGEIYIYGYFIDVGGVNGLLHIKNVKEPLKVNDQIKVLIESAEMDVLKPRIFLKAVTAEPEDNKAAPSLQQPQNSFQPAVGRRVKATDWVLMDVAGQVGFVATLDDGLQGFLLEKDVGLLASVLYRTSSTAKVTVKVKLTGEMIGGRYARVVRQ